MHSRRDQVTRIAVRLLIVTWLAYSATVLAWWAYTEPGSSICLGKGRNPTESAR
ncbi:MAG: hypothetical protein JNK52_11085 [Zoogloeaceae bacterium]|nr:hypothetical protein [Zoogloeaceae bacterium]